MQAALLDRVRNQAATIATLLALSVLVGGAQEPATLIIGGGLLLCDSRTHTAFVMSPMLGEVHVLSLTSGAGKLQRLLGYVTMKVSAEALRIECQFPEDGIHDELAGALVTREGVEAVVARHTPDRARKTSTVTCRRILELTRFRGRLTRPNFWAEVAHEVEQENDKAGAALVQRRV